MCDMPEPWKFPSLDCFLTVARRGSCGPRRKFVLLCTQSLVLCSQVRDVEKFPDALGFKSLDPFLRVSKQGPYFTAREEDGGDKRLAQLELADVNQ